MNSIEYRSPQKIYFPIIFAIAVAVISFFPSLRWTEISHHDNQRFAQAFVTIIGGLAIVRQLIRNENIVPLPGKASLYFLIGFFLLGLWSSLLAWSVRHAMFEWANFGLLSGLTWLVAKKISMAPSEMLDRVLMICGVGCAFYLFSWSIVYVSWLIVGVQPDWMSLIPGFDNYRFFNHVQTVTLPLLGLLVIRTRQRTRQHAAALSSPHQSPLVNLLRRHQTRFWWMILMLWWTLLFVTSGRGTFAGLLAGMIMVLVWRRQHALEWCRVIVSTCIAGLIAYPLLYIFIPKLVGIPPFGLLQEVASRTIADPTSSRSQLWQSAIQMIIDYPWLGVGPLHFAHFAREIKNGAHPHSWLLQIGSEWGIPALLCLAAVLSIALRSLLHTARAIKADDAPNQAILAAWLTTLVAIVVDGLVSGIIVMPASQLWIALYAGCAWGWTASFSVANNVATSRLRRGARHALMLGIILLISLLGYSLWPEARDLPAREEKIIKEGSHSGVTMLFPRIWRAGYF